MTMLSLVTLLFCLTLISALPEPTTVTHSDIYPGWTPPQAPVYIPLSMLSERDLSALDPPYEGDIENDKVYNFYYTWANFIANFDDVDWTVTNRIYFPAVMYMRIQFIDLPEFPIDNPMVFSNAPEGQVYCHYDYATGMSFSGGANYIVSGRYDETYGVGSPLYPGVHDGESGIVLDGRYKPSTMGITLSSASNVTFDSLEITRSGFAGMLIKKDNGGYENNMYNIKVLNNYIHDTDSEGMYIGSTQSTEAQHVFFGLKVLNNRVIRAGTEGIQTGQLADGCEIAHNIVWGGGSKWRTPFQIYQDGGFQLSHRYGSVKVHHNIFAGGSNTMNLQGLNAAADADYIPLYEDNGVELYENFILHPRNGAAYCNDKWQGTVSFHDNYLDGYEFLIQEVFTTYSEWGGLVRFGSIVNNVYSNPLNTTVENNKFFNTGNQRLVEKFQPTVSKTGTDEQGNSVYLEFTVLNNQFFNTSGVVVPKLNFNNVSWDGNGRSCEQWGPEYTVGTYNGQATIYPRSTSPCIIYDGDMYKLTVEETSPGASPISAPEEFELIAVHREVLDDYRFVEGSSETIMWGDIGLLSRAPNTDDTNVGNTDTTDTGNSDATNAGNTDATNAGNTDTNAGNNDATEAGNTDENIENISVLPFVLSLAFLLSFF